MTPSSVVTPWRISGSLLIFGSNHITWKRCQKGTKSTWYQVVQPNGKPYKPRVG